MLSRIASLVVLWTMLAVSDPRAIAGGVHIRYGPHAPERMAASNLLYYHGMLNLYHHHPIAFAREHPFYTAMFHHPAMMDRLVARWQAHETRFEYWHDCLWKVLDGYLVSHAGGTGHLTTSAGRSPVPGGLSPVVLGSPILNPVGPGGNRSNTGAGGGGGGETSNAVPEPSSGLLIVVGTLGAGAWVARRRRFTASSRGSAAPGRLGDRQIRTVALASHPSERAVPMVSPPAGG